MNYFFHASITDIQIHTVRIYRYGITAMNSAL